MHHTIALFSIFFSALILCCPNTAYSQCDADDWTALRTLYLSTDGPNWTNNSGWDQLNSATPPSNCDLANLYGVSVDTDGRVSALNLGNNNLSGILPSELAQLTQLTQLDISNNDLSGCYPASLAASNAAQAALASGGTTYEHTSSVNRVVSDFDPTKDVIDVGSQSVHTQIMIQQSDGLLFRNMFNTQGSLFLEGIALSDLQWFNFAPIQDAHFQQDISATLAYENCTGLSRPNTVYVRSHQENLVEEVDFNPATDKISFFYLCVRADGGTNFAVEQTAAGARFYSPFTGQSMTLKDVQFSELTPAHFEFRANQLEDNLAGRMSLDQVISNWQVDQNNVFNGKSVPMAGGEDKAPYHIYNHSEYTGSAICELGNSVWCNFSNTNISNGNNFDANWEDFCANSAGTCTSEPNQQAPAITINNPTNGATLQLGNQVTILVNAVDNDGTISSLTIAVNNVLLNSSNTSGSTYQANWTPTTIGNYSLTVTATDNDNQTTTEEISVAVFDNSTPQCNATDWAALRAFYLSTNGYNWTNNAGWEQVETATPPATCDLATMYGISLDSDGRVSGISLSNNNLTGGLPAELAQLTNLTQLNISNNSLSGCYDASFGASNGSGGESIESGGTTYVRSTSENQTITNFDPTKDKIDVGQQSIHTQIMLDSPDGLTFENMFNPNGKLILQGINLVDLKWFNFEPIADAHFQQDISAALAYENCTGLSRSNTVYLRSHETNLVEEVDFNPATDKVSFFYLAVRGDAGVNYAVEQTAAGARFYSPYTNQSMTLKDVQFSELTPAHFEFRANQLEDNLAGRMGLDQVISNWQIDQDNVYNGKSVPMAGGVDRAPYHIYNHDEYTGSPICAVSNSVLCNFSNANISDGNNFDAPWEDFCANGAGACDSEIGMQAPVVTINSPANGASYQLGNAITIIVNAIDNDGTISSLDILANDLLLNSSNTSGDIYEASWSPNAVGTYTISATATDNDNQTTTQDISVTIFDNSTPQCNTADWATLQAFYVATNGDSWTNNSGWEQVDPMLHPSTPPNTCDLANLYGVSLDANGRVNSISLPNNNLTGKIPDEIGDLSNLTALVLNDNAIAGALSSALARLTNLTQLNLTNNDLTGCYDANLGASSGGGESLESGGTTYVRSTSAVEVVTDFDPTKDKIDVGAQSVHTQIMIDNPDGLTFENMFSTNGKLVLQGINLADLQWFNFEPIADAHFQQDISAALAYENCTGLSRSNTVYVRSHEPNIVEEVDFNPATDKVSFFYLAVRGDAGVNFAVEQTVAGARFYSPYTNQSMTLKGVQFSELTPSHFEFRANQLEDNLAGRMGLDQVISNWQIDQNNVYNGKSVPMAGGVDKAPYHIYTHDEYTGTAICEVGNSVLCNFSNADISNGNDFDSPWEDFCNNGTGTCEPPNEPQAPVVTITSPTNGAVFQLGNAVTIQVTATDSDGTITSLDILANDLTLNSSNPSGNTYQATWTPTAVGTYTITVRATDNDNLTTNQTVSVIISDDPIPPLVAITNPYDGATLPLGNPITITAQASDSDGNVNNVTISVNGTNLSTSNEGNIYSATWNPSNTGMYTISVTATDDDNQTTSRSISVTISDDPPPTGDYNYGEVLQKSLYFYEAQQSGELSAENRVEWRGPSALDDGLDVSLDLTGGWYDAGDHVKFGFPMAYSATILAWSGVEDKTAYQNIQQWEILKNNLRFVNDYLLKCHVRNNDGSTNRFYGQVGNGSADHAWWGPAEVMQMNRPAYYVDANQPGSDLTGETAAALAAASIVFADEDPTYSAELLENAIALYNFADTYRGKYSDAITDAASFYNSWSGYQDELVWGAIWLYRATNDAAWLTKAQNEYQNLSNEQGGSVKSYKWTLAWDDKSYGCYALMAQLTGQQSYFEDTERWLDYWSTGYNGQRVSYSPGGQAHLDTWGSLRYTANTAFVALQYSELIANSNPSKSETYRDFGINQINYTLGSNPNNRSYVCGFGNNPPINPHHRTAHGSWANSLNTPTDNRHILYGALVGGPSGPNDQYTDDRGDYIANEVACDYNAGFTGAIANLVGRFGGTTLANFPEPEDYDVCEEYFNEAKINASGNTFTEVAVWAHNRSAWPATETEDVCYRYFMDLSEGVMAGYTASDYTISLNTAPSGTTVSDLIQWEGMEYYVEVCFDNTSIFPGGQSESRKEAQLRIALPNNAPATAWNPDNDWSYFISENNPMNNNLQANPRIPFYNDGQLLCGYLPGGGSQNSAPIADFTVNPTSGNAPLFVECNAYGSTDPDGDDLTFSWDFGDGHTHPGSITNHVFMEPGVHPITLTVDDGKGGTDTKTINITVIDATPQAPTAVIVATPTNGGYPLAVAFDGSGSTDPNGDMLTYSWDFGDGNMATGATVNHTYTTVGTYTATLTVDDGGNGGSDSETVAIEVVNLAPIATFTASPTTGQPPFLATFDAAGSSDPNGGSLTYSWDFGNGQTSTGVSATQTFSTAGSYTVTLTVTDELGATGQYSQLIQARESGCSLSLKYRTYDNTANGATDNQVRAHFIVDNLGTDPIALQDVTIRYWYSVEDVAPQNLWIDYARLGKNNITTKIVAMNSPETGADHYLEVGFTAGAGTIAAGENSGEVQTRFAKTNWSNYDETNDYSFNAEHNTYRLWDKVTVYCGDHLVWGIEPINEGFIQDNCTTGTLAVLGSEGGNSLTDVSYQAITHIAADATIESGAAITFKAGESIRLSEGFHAKGGSNFVAMIEDCPTNLQAPSVPLENRLITPKISSDLTLTIAPNPLIDQTNLYFNLSKPSNINLMITNGFGQLVANPINQVRYETGAHNFTLNTADYLAGIYFVHFRFDNEWLTKKILVVK